jgi:hypothetical protein
MKKKIPWIGNLKNLVQKYSQLGRREREGREYEFASKYHATFQRLLNSADFIDVTWNVVHFTEFPKKLPWRLHLDASFKRNRTQWMDAIKFVRDLGERVHRHRWANWDRAMHFNTTFGDATFALILIYKTHIELQFNSPIAMEAFCKKHQICDINAESQYRIFGNQVAEIKSNALSLASFVSRVRKWA